MLDADHEQALFRTLSRYPEVVESAALASEPHQIVFYLRDLANELHTYYNAHQFLVDDAVLRNARLTLVEAVRQVLANGLSLIGVSAPREHVRAARGRWRPGTTSRQPGTDRDARSRGPRRARRPTGRRPDASPGSSSARSSASAGSILIDQADLTAESLGASARAWLAGGSARSRGRTTRAEVAAEPTGPKFEFYTLLPEKEVAVSDEELEQALRRQESKPPVEKVEAPESTSREKKVASAPAETKTYMLQVGSFRRSSDADRLKATVALLGLQPSVQSVDVNAGETWYRVRGGPYTDPRRLEEARSQLTENGVKSLAVRIKQ